MTHFAVAPAVLMFMLLATKFTQKNETLNFRSNRGSCDTKVYICLSIHLTGREMTTKQADGLQIHIVLV